MIRRISTILIAFMLLVLPLTLTGCESVDTQAIASTLWGVAVSAVQEYIYRQIGADVSDANSVTSWVTDKVNSYDPEGKLTKYVNIEVVVEDAYNFVMELIAKVPMWSPGADPDIYAVVDHYDISPAQINARLANKAVFR